MSGCVLICGALFFVFSVWQTLLLSETFPGTVDMGFGGYFLGTTVAFYFLAALLLFMGLHGVRRNLRSPA